MTREEHLLTYLLEECVETAQRISKALRFGLDEVQPGQEMTNGERIVGEYCDILGVMGILQEEKILPPFNHYEHVMPKVEKVKKYMEYAEQCGTIEKPISFEEMCIINRIQLKGAQGVDGSKYFVDQDGYVHRL